MEFMIVKVAPTLFALFKILPGPATPESAVALTAGNV